MKILLSSVGRRGYLVKYFKQALGSQGQVWGGDSSPYAAGFAYCDRRILLPTVDTSEYVDFVLDLCRKEGIDIVIPLIDPELEVLSLRRDDFQKNGIMVVVSPHSTVQMCYDKYETFKFAQQHGIAAPLTILSVEEALKLLDMGALRWPLSVKPRKGSASEDICHCRDEDRLCRAFEVCPEPMIQQYLEGDEFGYDLFGDQNFRSISVYCKKKLAMRAGETDKAISTADPVHINFGRKILESMQLFGPADVDVIVDGDGPKLLEINPRFGGGYPCSHMAGADFCRKLISIRLGKELSPDIGSCPDGICMLKQDEIIRPDWNSLSK